MWQAVELASVDALIAGPSGLPGSALCRFGFSGAEIVDFERIFEVAHPGDMVLLGLDTEIHRRFGEHNSGAASFVRKNTICMLPWTDRATPKCHDIGMLNDDSFPGLYADLIDTYRRAHQLGLKPALIACDHTASLLGVTGLLESGESGFIYLYFDAHFDLGLHNRSEDIHNGNFAALIASFDGVTRLVNIGGRSWSTSMGVYDSLPGFVHFPCGPGQLNSSALIQKLSWIRGARLYVSIDADVLDPSCAPSACCPEPFGLGTSDLLAICEWIGASCEVVGGDLCEIFPSDRTLGSEQALMRCLHALFGRHIPESTR
jgi:agmatinase